MNPTHEPNPRVPLDVPLGGFLSWRRILAGTFAAVAIYFLLTMLGMGLGFAVASPSADQDTIATIGIGAGITWVLSTLISLFVGGWIAGASPLYASGRAGMVQGLMVWSLVMIFSLVVVTTMAGRVAGTAMNVAGAAVQAVGQPLAAAASKVGGAATDALASNADQITSYVEEAIASAGDGRSFQGDASAQPAGTGGQQGQPQPALGGSQDRQSAEAIRATRELTAAMGRYFTRGTDDTQARQELIQALNEHTGMSQQEAEEAVRSWTRSYERVQEDIAQAAETAQEAAVEVSEQATTAAAHAGIWGFFAWLLGAAAAVIGGRLGALKKLGEPEHEVHHRRTTPIV